MTSDFQEKLQELCMKFPACHCPKSHEAKRIMANTPEWLRRYYAELGKEELRASILERIK